MAESAAGLVGGAKMRGGPARLESAADTVRKADGAGGRGRKAPLFRTR